MASRCFPVFRAYPKQPSRTRMSRPLFSGAYEHYYRNERNLDQARRRAQALHNSKNWSKKLCVHSIFQPFQQRSRPSMEPFQFRPAHGNGEPRPIRSIPIFPSNDAAYGHEPADTQSTGKVYRLQHTNTDAINSLDWSQIKRAARAPAPSHIPAPVPVPVDQRQVVPQRDTRYQPPVLRLQKCVDFSYQPQAAEDDRSTLYESNSFDNPERKYAIDMTGSSMNDMRFQPREKRDLFDLMRHMPAIPNHIREKLYKDFTPCNFCPTTLFSDVSAIATVHKPKYLDMKNPHPWDSRIKFVDEPHKYFIDGSCQDIMSCTAFYGTFFPKFDVKKQALSTFNSKTFRDCNHRPSYKYHGCKSPEDIEKKWEWWRDLGTMLHADIENYWNMEPLNIHDENKVCFEQFKLLFQDKDWAHWEPYRTEWSVFDPETMIAGQIDMVGMIDRELGHVVLIDWKRCESIGDYSFGDGPRRGFGVCSSLANAKYPKYCLQLNIYKYILEKYYGLFVKKMFLVQMHPRLKKQAAIHKVCSLQGVVEEMMACRKMVLEKAREDRRRNGTC